MNDYQRSILVTNDVIVVILNFAANGGVVIALLMTKFLRNTYLCQNNPCRLLVGSELCMIAIFRNVYTQKQNAESAAGIFCIKKLTWIISLISCENSLLQ